MPQKNTLSGFTLIELLIVIAVLGVLAAGVVVAINPSKRISDAQKAIVKTDFSSMDSIIEGDRAILGVVLGIITGSFCSDCAFCRGGVDTRSSSCVNSMNQAWQKVANKNMPKDPWGNPYIIDENDGETANCITDGIRSPGPDHVAATADDISYRIPTLSCT